MTEDERREAALRSVLDDRGRQGLPRHIEDPAMVALLADFIISAPAEQRAG